MDHHRLVPYCSEVSTTVPERIPLTLREQLLQTLECPSCRMIFRAPVATCKLGHSNCYCCFVRLGRCGICCSDLTSYRNCTIEAQLGLVDVECEFSLCASRIKASKLYEHFGRCEFRPIQCNLPIMAAAGGARVDCVAEMPFEDYVYHLTQVHGVTRFELSDAEGFYDFKYGARGDDFCGLPNIISALTIPVPLLVGTKTFLLHSQLRENIFNVWTSAMFSEEEASEYTVRFQLIRAKNFDPGHRAPQWEIRTHNYHKNKTCVEAKKDRVSMPPTLLQRYAEVVNGKWNWTVLCNIARRPLRQYEPPEITLD